MLELKSVKKSFQHHGQEIVILNGVNLKVEPSMTFAIQGKSGSGKSTLLNTIGGLERPESGEVKINGVNLYQLSSDQLSETRAQKIGFVFQHFHLIPTLNVEENIKLPLEIIGDHDQVKKRIDFILDLFGLTARAQYFPDKLSGGEMQRVAIARALIHRPALILADEPNANLDEQTAQVVMDYLFKAVKELEQTLLLVTHDNQLARRCDSYQVLEQGQLK